MSGVFADASFYVAVLNRRDALHTIARAAAEKCVGPITTTEFVLLEVANFCVAGRQRDVFLRLLERMRMSGDVEIIQVTPELFQSGLELFAARPDKTWSLTDCTSFVVMQQRGIVEALTADDHFEQAGFVTLLT